MCDWTGDSEQIYILKVEYDGLQFELTAYDLVVVKVNISDFWNMVRWILMLLKMIVTDLNIGLISCDV